MPHISFGWLVPDDHAAIRTRIFEAKHCSIHLVFHSDLSIYVSYVLNFALDSNGKRLARLCKKVFLKVIIGLFSSAFEYTRFV